MVSIPAPELDVLGGLPILNDVPMADSTLRDEPASESLHFGKQECLMEPVSVTFRFTNM